MSKFVKTTFTKQIIPSKTPKKSQNCLVFFFLVVGGAMTTDSNLPPQWLSLYHAHTKVLRIRENDTKNPYRATRVRIQGVAAEVLRIRENDTCADNHWGGLSVGVFFCRAVAQNILHDKRATKIFFRSSPTQAETFSE